MKKILITGATDGIGLETAKVLASSDHHLLMHGRNKDKLDKAIQSVKSIAPNSTIEGYLADLSDFADITALTESILEQHCEVDVIINNAGIFKTAHPITKDGLDVRFVVNTFAPAIISRALLPILSEAGRIVNLSSAAQAPIDVDAMAGKKALNDDFQAYAQSKLALTIWSHQFAKSLPPKQVSVAVNPASMLASKMVKEGFGVAGHDLSVGVKILISAALSDEFSDASGKYFDNDIKKFSSPHPFANNTSQCEQVMTSLKAIISKYTA
ncbi:SDR family NAD(P)-dependent oxidoreductase [Aliiglaciecola lipolytica]|uniref:Short-chain dehydrogenase/reductase SDR n=1 Tax=Aliiglaciecola lipolytica E3 TaxID=1127673 RepID=K6WWN2_9ALTE|nr:SDR family NAD(P)-dependent oxidoreductase [Aliiglaciecola lipolytica]GAC12834.1 short-chain dehydrogenase/reductase SDR [Aliiglaciecola lipolytica E3]